MVSKYKSLLLNTFLNGAKDEDDLIRASSLANLGEICKVLGYKVGTIGTEVSFFKDFQMVCLHFRFVLYPSVSPLVLGFGMCTWCNRN